MRSNLQMEAYRIPFLRKLATTLRLFGRQLPILVAQSIVDSSYACMGSEETWEGSLPRTWDDQSKAKARALEEEVEGRLRRPHQGLRLRRLHQLPVVVANVVFCTSDHQADL